MSVNEKLMAPGTFNVYLSLETTPNSILNTITPWGNIVLTSTRVNPTEFTDAQLRDMARYVGIVQNQAITEEGIEIAGIGILGYLGDTDSRGMVLARNAGVGAVRSYTRDTLDDVLDRSTSTPYGVLRGEDATQKAVRKGSVVEVQYDDTVLLLNYEGSNGDTTTSDGSVFTSNQLITFSGTADISTDQAKFGSTSLNLTTDGFVTVADRPELDLTYQEFTCEWWEYRTSSSGNPTVWARNNDTYSPWIFGKAVDGRNKAFITHDGNGYGTADDLNMDMGSIDLNQWNHFAISHKGDLFRTFKNGVQVAEVDRPELFVRVSSDSLQIGKGQAGNFFEGYLDGMVITRGNAKYWDAFTPSTSAPTATTDNKTYTGKHYMESAYKSLKTICTSLDAEFKMQNDGTIDVGPRTSLFTGHEDSEPTGMIVRRLSGLDAGVKGYSGADLKTEFNAEDFVSRVELIASNYGKEINLGQADAKDIPYKDLHGNELERIQILSENEVPDSMRNIRAEAYLNEYNKVQRTLSVGLEDYDLSGDIGVGDVIFVFDPEVGFEDTQDEAKLENRDRHEIAYQGQILNPIKIRVMGLSFPISDSMGVFYRNSEGVYTDLTDYVAFESGVTQVEVGSTTPNINEDLRASASVIAVGGTNEFTVPDAPTSFAAASGTYQDGAGRPFAFAKLTWNEPTNTDGSRITDGNMYRVRYRQVTDVDGNNLIDSNDNQVTDYEYLTVEFGTTAVVIKGLGPNNTYEFGVACIDNSGFSGGFAVITASQMPADATIPPEPTAPTGSFGSIAASATKVQITHKLGAAKTVAGAVISSPSNFTLPRDIDHLNVYRGLTSSFTISSTNFVGEIAARAGHIDGSIPAIATFAASTAGTAFYRVTAVDVAGNESDPSTAVQVEEELISTAFIDDATITTAKIGDLAVTDAKIDTLTAAKITAGTISGKEIIIDTDSSDPSNPVLGTIRSNNYITGNAGWIIKSDGSVEFETGTFRGDLEAAGGSFSGNLSAAGGNFTGTLSGVDGNFTGTITANQISGGTINADILDGGTIDGSSINLGSGTFTVDTNGAMVASSATITGNITANSGTIGGTSINANTLATSNFSNTAGYELTSTGATFHNVNITGTLTGASIDGTIDGTVRTASGNTYIELASDNGSTMSFVKSGGAFGTLQDNSGFFALGSGVNASGLVLSSAVGPTKIVTNAGLDVGGNIGNSNMVLLGGNSPFWGSVPGTSGVTSLTSLNSAIVLGSNTGGVTMNFNPSNLDDTHDHTSSNAAGTTFTGDNHGNNHGVNMSNVLNSSNSGGGTYHSHTTSAVNALSTAASSVLNLTANTGSILINHLDNDHANFANSGHGHNYANSGHGHDYAANSHGHDYAANSHGHGSSYLSNSHDIGHPSNHNHPYSSSGHGHGNTYANFSHFHINPLTHDSRLLDISANTVPGLNVVNRLNPVTANFSADYLERAKKKQGAVDELDGVTYRLTQQDVKQAFTDDGLDPSTIAMIIEDVTYAKNDKPGLAADEPMKGLMDGEIDAILVQAIKDLSAKIGLLEDRITTLEG